MKGIIKKIEACAALTVRNADPATTHVYFKSGLARYEICRRDGRYWSREFGAPASEPWRPTSGRTLSEIKEELSCE